MIAEIGINHEGSLKTAFEMVMSGDAKSVIPGNANVSIYEIMHRCSLNEEDERALMEYVQSKDMIFPCGGRAPQKI